MSTVRIPPTLRSAANGAKTVDLTGANVGEVLAALVAAHPAIGPSVLAADGSLNRFVNVFVNGTDVRHLDELATPVAESDTVLLLPAMAGG
jgi:molybdopterin converting factor small subunit